MKKSFDVNLIDFINNSRLGLYLANCFEWKASAKWINVCEYESRACTEEGTVFTRTACFSCFLEFRAALRLLYGLRWFLLLFDCRSAFEGGKKDWFQNMPCEISNPSRNNEDAVEHEVEKYSSNVPKCSRTLFHIHGNLRQWDMENKCFISSLLCRSFLPFTNAHGLHTWEFFWGKNVLWD